MILPDASVYSIYEQVHCLTSVVRVALLMSFSSVENGLASGFLVPSIAAIRLFDENSTFFIFPTIPLPGSIGSGIWTRYGEVWKHHLP